MPNIFDTFDPVPTDDVGFVTDPPQQQPPNIFDSFDSIPATTTVSGGVPIDSNKAQLERAQFLATILHPPVVNPGVGVHQPSMFSSGFFPGAGEPISLQNADDWGFLATAVPKILNNAVTRTVGTGLNAAGQAIKGGVESDLFKATGQPDLATQEKIATIAKIFPQLGLNASAHGVDISDPYEDARQTLPAAERIASGIGPGFLQSAPQMALTAVQPELGAVSFGFTPDGFDPVQAATMMIAPVGGKMIGGVAKDLAVKAGISDAQALDVINRLGGGAGVAGLVSAPTAYQIGQMKPSPERNEAIQDAALNAIIAGVFGGIGEHSAPEKPIIATADTTQNIVPRPTEEEDLPVQAGPAKQQQQKPVSEKLDLLTAMLNDVQDMLRGKPSVPGQHAVEESTDPVDQIIRNIFPAEEGPAETINETPSDGTAQPVRDSTVPPKLVVPEISQAKNVPGSATAVPVAPEPHYVYSPDGIGGLDQQVAQAGVKKYLRRQNNVPPVQIVNDPSWTHNGYGVRGTVQDGQISESPSAIERGSDSVLRNRTVQGKAISAVPAADGPNFASSSKIPTIRGRIPINSRYAGQIHPSGIKFTSQGFPDFSPHAIAQVEIDGLTGRYAKDAALANKAISLKKTPAKYVWHHVEDGKTMQLVPKRIHKIRHTGGSAVIRNRGFDK